jgi:hypothetical protein
MNENPKKSMIHQKNIDFFRLLFFLFIAFMYVGLIAFVANV